MKYEVTVHVVGAQPPTGRPVQAVTFFVSDSVGDIEKIVNTAITYALAMQQRHPRKYRGASFHATVDDVRRWF